MGGKAFAQEHLRLVKKGGPRRSLPLTDSLRGILRTEVVQQTYRWKGLKVREWSLERQRP